MTTTLSLKSSIELLLSCFHTAINSGGYYARSDCTWQSRDSRPKPLNLVSVREMMAGDRFCQQVACALS
jgi:hypothetical protein